MSSSFCRAFWSFGRVSASNIGRHEANTAWRDNTLPEHTDFFVGWGTLSLINAGLAQAKGRSGLLWWIASLFLGPIATFLIVILDRVPS